MKLRLQPLFLMDPADVGGAGGDPPKDPPADPPTPRTFTQEEVNAIVQERVARVKREEPEDYAEAKELAAKWREFEESQKTELQKAQDEAKKAQKEAAAAAERAKRQLVEAAILTEATKASAIKPEHMSRLIDTSSVTIGDDGQVTGAGEAVAAFLEANPEYVGKPRGVKDDLGLGARGSTPGQITREQLRDMSPAEIVKAQNEGLLDEVLGKTK